jgi:hypothetical protein
MDDISQHKDQILDHIERLLYVIRNAACYRALSKYNDEINENFMKMIYNNFFDMAILEWCKVFGADSEYTHWKTLVKDHISFRQELLKSLEISQFDWEAYWKDIKNYRDKFIAHHQRDLHRTHYPRLNIAVKSSFYYYYKWLIIKLNQLNIYLLDLPDDLEDYYEDFQSQASKFAEVSFLSP